MKTGTKRCVALVLSFALLFTLLPGTVFAASEDEQTPVTKSDSLEDTQYFDPIVQVNPLYADILDTDDLQWDDSDQIATYAVQTFTTEETTADYIRQQLVDRTGTVSLVYAQSSAFDNDSLNAFLTDVLSMAMGHMVRNA